MNRNTFETMKFNGSFHLCYLQDAFKTEHFVH